MLYFKGIVEGYNGGFMEPCMIYIEVNGEMYMTDLLVHGFDIKDYMYDRNRYIQIDLKTFISIIESIPNRALTDIINSDIPDDEVEDLKVLQRDFAKYGIKLSLRECECIHDIYSDSLCAGFISIGDSADVHNEINCVIAGIYKAMKYDYCC